MEKTLLLISGGIDSIGALAWAHDKFECEALFIDYGWLSNKYEYEAARKYCMQLNVPLNAVPLQGLDDATPRNAPPIGSLVLHSIAIYNALALRCRSHIYPIHSWDVICHPDDPSRLQADREYINRVEDLVTCGLNIDYDILTPFIHVPKYEIIDLLRLSGICASATVSCSRPSHNGHCGVCTACVERKVAFQMSSVRDQTRYIDKSNFTLSDLIGKKQEYFDIKTHSVIQPSKNVH